MVRTIAVRLLMLGFCMICFHAGAQRVYYPTGSLGEYETMRAGVVSSTGYRSNLQEQAYYRYFQLEQKSDTSRRLMIEIIKTDIYTTSYLSDDNLHRKSKKSLGPFYQYPSALYAKKDTDYLFVVNPVLNVSGAKETATSRTLYQNSRGAEIWGNIGGNTKGVGFYSYFTDNQMVMPKQYTDLPDSLNFVPNELFYKKFKTGTGVDFFQARGYITFNAAKNHIHFKFGHDRNKIGNGYRSLILSDFAPQYLFFKINTNLGRVHYQNLFTQFTDNGPVLSNVLFGKKYAAFHRLSVDVTDDLSFGLNEMVIFDRMDSTQMNQFDLNYLNPVIFYRSVESNLGSRDNSLMALDFNYTLKNMFLFYGQFVLDEFKLNEIKSNKNWWGNKYGWQLGVRGFAGKGIRRSDFLLELNNVRPYTYSHARPTQSYSHFNQPLAHPLGSNFFEMVAEIKEKLSYRWFVNLTFIEALQGKDSFLNGRNYGSNILRSYDTRVTNDSALMFMGKHQNIKIGEVVVSYMVRHNLFIDLRFNYRSNGTTSNVFYGVGIRLNSNLRQANF